MSKQEHGSISLTSAAPTREAVAPPSSAPVETLGARMVVAWLVAAIAIVVVLFHETAWSLVQIWARSDTFAHGFLIIPISLWVVWEKREGVKRLTPAPTPWPLLLFVPIGFGWLVGDLVDALVVQQFAFVAMLAVTIWSVLGDRLARYLAFPILFLFFGVPAGEGLIYPMMNFTADFTVGMLELTGIPVYREGTFFTIPTGHWSVVEACSGFRYLIASVTLGVLFAFLTYTKWWKRLLFVAVAILVPILANGLRAYMLVMIGHLTKMNFGTGADHLFYGWVFFAVVITLMLGLGTIWRDPAAPLPVSDGLMKRPVRPGRIVGVVAGITVAAAFWPFVGWALSDHGRPVTEVRLTPPQAAGWEWIGDASYWDWRPQIAGADGSLYAFYRKADAPNPVPVGLYVGVYRTQRQGAEIVNRNNRMVAERHPVWGDTLVTSEVADIDSRSLSVEQHQLSSRHGQRLLVWTWYLVGGRHVADPYLAKLLEAKSRLTGNRGEGALIAVAAPYQDFMGTATDSLTAFLRAMLPAVEAEVERSLETGN